MAILENAAAWTMAMVLIGAVGAIGCGADGSSTTEGGSGGTGGSGGMTTGTAGSGGSGGGMLCPDDPAEGATLEECGVWVSISGDDKNPGTQAAPVRTLMHAIDLAKDGTGHVYACGETWEEVVVVPSGVSLHGGFDCANDWAYSGNTARAMILSPTPFGITWIDGGSMEMAFMTDFYVEAADATEPGGGSIAAFVRDTLPLTLLRSEFVAGNGADGLDGAPGDPDGLPAMKGAPGNDGANACSGALSPGGAAVLNDCVAGGSTGGAGGDSTLTLAKDGADGEPVSDPPAGEGGLGATSTSMCTNGSSGAKGAAGAYGEGGKSFGRLTVDGWVGVSGEDGQPGAPGQGGGGGGAVLGSTIACGVTNSAGAAGGSGGAGGCGGKGGGAGQSGGASLAFATRSFIHVWWTDVILRTKNGGKGGDGGFPQFGGAGGLGGMGGKGVGSIPTACTGGNGGAGGTGGRGSGGTGGTTLAIAVLWGAPPGPTFGFEVDTGSPGLGGKGDPQGGNGIHGQEAISAYMDP